MSRNFASLILILVVAMPAFAAGGKASNDPKPKPAIADKVGQKTVKDQFNELTTKVEKAKAENTEKLRALFQDAKKRGELEKTPQSM